MLRDLVGLCVLTAAWAVRSIAKMHSARLCAKDADRVLASLGKAVKNMGESVDRLSKEVADKAEKEI
jgi:hypothetical protein